MRPNASKLHSRLADVLTLSLALCFCLPAGSHASGDHRGLPTPSVELAADEVSVPFVIPESFPVPVVEVMIDGTGPWRLAVDTGTGGTLALRRELVASIGLPVVGKAMIGDSSGASPKPADLVRIEQMVVGGLTVRDIIGVGFTAGNDHLSEVPDDLHGILGNQIYAELLTTLDYPNRQLVFRRGTLDPAAPGTVDYLPDGKLMLVDLEVAGTTLPVAVDSGHRGTITLPRSLADELPLAGEPRDLKSMSTVSDTYERSADRLAGEAVLAGTRLARPEVIFSDESSPLLLGFGVLQHFALTIDQASHRLRFAPLADGPIEGITVTR